MKYFNITQINPFSHILCGKLISHNFVHMTRKTDIHVLIIVEKGILNIEIDGVRYKIHPSEMIILPADVLHKGYTDNDTPNKIQYFWSHFKFDNNFEITDTPYGDFSLPMIFKLPNFSRVQIICNQLLDVSLLSEVRKKYCDYLFTALCFEIASQLENETASDNSVVNKILSWIEYHITKQISLSDVCKNIGYNKRYISRIFKENTGKTVNEYITEKKLSVSKQLLSGSDETIASIAYMIGYNDSSYFMRLFKKHEGITCSEYRNAYSKMRRNDQ